MGIEDIWMQANAGGSKTKRVAIKFVSEEEKISKTAKRQCSLSWKYSVFNKFARLQDSEYKRLYVLF